MTGSARPSSEALAELARAGYSSLRQPLAEVSFEVHHMRDEPGYFFREVSTSDNRRFLETLSSSVNGAGLLAGTRTEAVPPKLRVREGGSTTEPAVSFHQHENGNYEFRGSARPNLTFLSESDRRFEALISLDVGPPGPLTLPDGLRVKRLLLEIGQLAADAQAPLLFVQSAAQLPIDESAEDGDGTIPPSSSFAVRFAIALRTPSAKIVLQLAEQLSAYCDKHGYRWWLADTRLGYRTGNWYEIHPAKPPARQQNGVHAGEPILTILPVTFVGPARVGSTTALLRLLTHFPAVGVVGTSSALLEDLAFVHVQLGLAEVPDGELAHRFGAGESPVDTMSKILKGVSANPPAPITFDTRTYIQERAGDYQTLAGPLLPAVPTMNAERLGIWFSWQMDRAADGLAKPMQALRQALVQVGLAGEELAGGEAPNIEYLVCRDLGNSIIRGRGKLSVPFDVVHARFPRTNVEAGPSTLCVSLEDAWKAELDELPETARVHEVTVAWREHWLGRWAATLV
ncbi:hypothetical protein [Amycolatopsis magusensis]|uniref:hypothetical protein n=1 Tax=Amycolatopsis magusensis TaxID=882444 RepID=UPI0024A9157A|nr:hypothetical protein [Amycolatopsis magusensis]MDI5977050.1 hypothetical protein [Amycolatopsis magusensis]